MMAITTAGVRTDSRGHDSLCFRMYRHGKDVAAGVAVDPTFFFSWWEPAAGIDADHRDPDVWRECNPGYGDLVAELDFHSTLQRVHESDFRAKRLNVFVAARDSWLPYGAWDACADPSAHLEDGDTITLGFDGSIRSDSTAIVAVRANYGEKPLVSLLAIWERPSGDPEWLVPVAAVLDSLRELRTRYRVTEVAADTSYWQEPLQRLHREGMRIVDFAQTPERLNPATQGFYEAVMTGGLVHDGNEVLARHIRNAVLKYGTHGAHIVKPQATSEAHVDAAQAAVFAFDRVVKRSGAGAAWLQHFRNEIAKEQEQPSTEPSGDAAAQPQTEATGPSPSPRDILLGPGSTLPGPRVACQHRWMRESWGTFCVLCQEPKET